MTAIEADRQREIAASYDESPYQSVSLLETHPDRLASVARVMGLTTPPLHDCRVLELGCAGGGNLVPIALSLPGASLIGVDISPVQIEQAKALARDCGVTNVEFLAKSLLEIGPDFGTFDYILCHGVYSWVPAEARAAILRICSENLAADGVAFVSYNVYPGWHVSGMIREMMMYHVRGIHDPLTKARSARGFLDFLGESVPDKEAPYGKILRDEAAQLRLHGDSYLLHEHLEAINDPIYYHEFVDRAAYAKLKVLADARFYSMAISAQPAFAQSLDRVGTSPVDREQYFDFLCNRRFRRSLLCHETTRTSPKLDPERIKTLAASALLRPGTSPVDTTTTQPLNFLAPDGSVRMVATDPLTKTTLVVMHEAAPLALPFDDLRDRVSLRLSGHRLDASNAPESLPSRLLQCYGGNAIELHAHEPPIDADPGERPKAFPIARLSAARGPSSLTNLWHAFVNLGEFDALVLRQLDGTRDRAEIVEALVSAVASGSFQVAQDGRRLVDPAVIRPLMERSLPPSLARLARAALLMR